MAPKWYELMEKNLEPGDEIKKTYAGKLDGNGGYLCLSDKKLLFVHEEGFLRKTYDLTLDLPYTNIVDVSREGRFNLKIQKIEGGEHKFLAQEVPASAVERSFEELTDVKRALA